MIALSLALLCLLASGLLDLVYKLYVSKGGSRGLMIAGVALIWGALQFTVMSQSGSSIATDQATLLLGGLAALALTISNLALLECLARLPISVASTIYRLNTIPLILMAVVLLGEDLNVYRVCGILAGLVTVVLLHSRVDSSVHSVKSSYLWFGVVVFACIMRASYGILTKAGLNEGASADSMMLLAAAVWLLGGGIYYWLVEAKRNIRLGSVKLIAAAGVLVFSVVWLLTTALSLGDASFVVPIANMGFVAAFVFSLTYKLEQITSRKVVAIATAIVSIGFLTYGL